MYHVALNTVFSVPLSLVLLRFVSDIIRESVDHVEVLQLESNSNASRFVVS
jgi:hypothetical protein